MLAMVRRATTTAAGVVLFAMAVVLALQFENPVEQPPAPSRTAQLFLALAALWPAGLTAYLAGRAQYRGATIAAGVTGVLYVAIAAVQYPRAVIPVVAGLGLAGLGAVLVSRRGGSE
jgi:hypothetical protein